MSSGFCDWYRQVHMACDKLTVRNGIKSLIDFRRLWTDGTKCQNCGLFDILFFALLVKSHVDLSKEQQPTITQ